MTEGLSIGAIVLAVVVWLLNEPLWEFCKGRWDEFSKKRMFKVCFVDKSPPNETEIDSWGPHPITDGESNQFLRVLCRYSWKAGKFNVRFLDLEELSLGPGESLIDVRPIIKIVGVQLPPEVQAQGISVIPIDDEKGGFDIVLRPPLELAAWGTADFNVAR